MDNLVFSNMMHRPARSLVSIFGIAIGVLLIVFTVGMTNGSMREKASREANVGAELMFRPSGTGGLSGSDALTLDSGEAAQLLKIEGVKAAIAIGQTAVNSKDTYTGSRLVDGVNYEEYAQMAGLQIMQGRVFAADAKDEVIIDTGWQEQKKLKVGDSLELWERNFKIVGTYEPAAGARIKMPLPAMQEQLGAGSKCSMILVSIKEGYTAEQVGESILKVFPNNQLLKTKDLEELYGQSIPFLNTFLNVIVAIAAIISALVILLTMYTTVTERTRQIGIMKALGMSNPRIAWIIAQEALLISFCGVVAGVVLAILLRFILSAFTTLNVEIDPLLVGITLIVGLIGGALGALYPAMIAARMDAVEALSYE